MHLLMRCPIGGCSAHFLKYALGSPPHNGTESAHRVNEPILSPFLNGPISTYPPICLSFFRANNQNIDLQ